MSNRTKPLSDCRTQDDFVRHAKHKGATITHGRHTCVEHNGHKIPLGHSNGELPIGTRRSIIRALAAIGLAVLVMALAAAMVIP